MHCYQPQRPARLVLAAIDHFPNLRTDKIDHHHPARPEDMHVGGRVVVRIDHDAQTIDAQHRGHDQALPDPNRSENLFKIHRAPAQKRQNILAHRQLPVDLLSRTVALMLHIDPFKLREYFRSEGRAAIRDAPFAFVLAILLAIALTFAAVDWHFAGEVETQHATIEGQHSTIESQKIRIDELQEQLRGAAPALAADRARRKQIVEQLQKFYIQAGSLFGQSIKDQSTFDTFKPMVDLWANDASNWIERNMGPAAKERFLDPGTGSSLSWNKAFNAEHNNYLNFLTYTRKNLSTLIETNAWDG
jgi:hypothetical protein